MPALRSRKKSWHVALRVALSALTAVVLAALVHVVLPPAPPPLTPATPSDGPAYVIDLAEPVYSLDPVQISLTTADVGPHFPRVLDGGASPTQRPLSPLPYQQQYYSGSSR